MPIKKPVDQWKIQLPVLRNTLLWQQLWLAALIAALPLSLLLVTLNLYEQQWEQIPLSLLIGALLAISLGIFLSLTALVVFGRGVPTRYVLTDTHIEQHTESKIARLANRLGILGIFAGSSTGFGVAGASLIAQSRESIAVEWRTVRAIKTFPEQYEIRLSNEWRPLMQVICRADQFAAVTEWIKHQVTPAPGITQRDSNRSSLPLNTATPFAIKLILALLAIVFGIMLLPRLPIHFVGAFTLPMIAVALASLWTAGNTQRILAVLLLVLPIVGVAAAFFAGEVGMHRPGAQYALAVEIVSLAYFCGLGIAILWHYVR